MGPPPKPPARARLRVAGQLESWAFQAMSRTGFGSASSRALKGSLTLAG